MADKHSNQVLLDVISSGDLDLVAQLYEEGCSINIADDDKRSPLHICAIQGHADIAMWLIGRGIVVNARDKFGLTALHLSCIYNSEGVLKVLLDSQSANINALSKRRFSPLMIACWFNFVDIVRLLLENNADTLLQSEDGFCAIHYAVWNGHLDVFQVMQEMGVEIKTKSEKGLDILDLARIQHHQSLVQYLSGNNDLSHSNTLAFRTARLEYVGAEDGLPNIKEITDINDDIGAIDQPHLYGEKQNEEAIIDGQKNLADETDAFMLGKKQEVIDDFLKPQVGYEDMDIDTELEEILKGIEDSKTSEIIPVIGDDKVKYEDYEKMHMNRQNIEQKHNTSEIVFDTSYIDNDLMGEFLPPTEEDIYRTINGQYVDNVFDLVISNLLAMLHVPYYIKRVIYGSVSPGEQQPSFSFVDSNGDFIVWDMVEYDASDAVQTEELNRLILWYQKNGFNSGTNLFITYIDRNNGVDSVELYNIAHTIKQQLS